MTIEVYIQADIKFLLIEQFFFSRNKNYRGNNTHGIKNNKITYPKLKFIRVCCITFILNLIINNNIIK